MINQNNLKNILWLIDMMLLSIIYTLLHYNKFNIYIPEGIYLNLYIVSIFFWSMFSFYYKKYNSAIDQPILLTIRLVFWSSLVSLLFIVISISFSDMWSISRLFVLSLTFITILLEIVSIFILKIYLSKTSLKIININYRDHHFRTKGFYIKWLIPGAISLILIYIFTASNNSGSFEYDRFHEHNILLLLSAWGLSTILTNRYQSPDSTNHFYEISPYFKASILTFLFLNLFYFTFRINQSSINLLLQVGIIQSFLENSAFFLYFFGKSIKKDDNDKTLILNNTNNNQEKLLIIKDSKKDTDKDTKREIHEILKDIELKNKNIIIDYIYNSIKTENIKKRKFTIFNTKSSDNIKFLRNNSKELIINFHKINDIRRINAYLLDVYSKLENNGIIVGNYIPLDSMNNHLRSQMPHFLYSILIPFYFTFFRVFPILTITKQIYFILTQGKNRVLSKSEVLGRLSFCGYETISEKVINDTCYFIAKKKRTVSQERYPSYGPIVKLKRIGYNGERIYIYKVRTMYPYSEFIQGDIYEKHHINKSGKFQNDFRITTWGKFFRAYFIDEIPQLYNWLIGDIKLVGVRALSEQYFNLYPKDIQELRVKSKPGLIPPYYADMPNSFEEIVNSEKKYLLEKEKKPIKTDLKYLTKAFYNIIFHGARSK